MPPTSPRELFMVPFLWTQARGVNISCNLFAPCNSFDLSPTWLSSKGVLANCTANLYLPRAWNSVHSRDCEVLFCLVRVKCKVRRCLLRNSRTRALWDTAVWGLTIIFSLLCQKCVALLNLWYYPTCKEVISSKRMRLKHFQVVYTQQTGGKRRASLGDLQSIFFLITLTGGNLENLLRTYP